MAASAPAIRRDEFDEVKTTLKDHLEECRTEQAHTQDALRSFGASMRVMGEAIEKAEDAIKGFQDIGDGLRKIAWRGFVSVVGVIATVGITLLLQNWNTERTHAHERLEAPARYTAEDAKRDRAELLAEIRKIKGAE